MNNSIFWKIFSKRAVLSFAVLMFLFFFSILRVTALATQNYEEVSNMQKSVKLTVSKPRGTIYDCNMVPLTNNSEKIIAAISPTPRAVTAISGILKGEELNNVLERLRGGKPVLCQVPEEIDCEGIKCFKIYENTYNGAAHILGYTNKDGIGMSGLEGAFQEILYSENETYISYECDGKGNILSGIEPRMMVSHFAKSQGVVTTIDINVQEIAEEAANNLKKGAIVVSDCKTGEIKAMVSRPNFNKINLADFLSAPDSPLLNRAINLYNVGSVFKPCVAAAGIENKLQGFCYECTGSCEIIDRHFKCHKIDGHKYMNLKNAIANSCNTFFYNFAFKTGGESIYNTAEALRFNKSLPLCENINTAKGNLPQKESLKNIAYLANLSIGQGELLLSPVSILTLYNAIATNGSYYIPSIVKATIENGEIKPIENTNPTKVFSENTAALLRECLAEVLISGTGESAKPLTVTAAGKTATAQTGKFENGVEICEGWFCGFFPFENPKYTVVVFSEDTRMQEKNCNEIFAFLADKIAALYN